MAYAALTKTTPRSVIALQVIRASSVVETKMSALRNRAEMERLVSTKSTTTNAFARAGQSADTVKRERKMLRSVFGAAMTAFAGGIAVLQSKFPGAMETTYVARSILVLAAKTTPQQTLGTS